MYEILLLLAGALLGWFLQRLSDVITKPQMKIELGDEGFLKKGTPDEVKFLHVIIKNVKKNLLMRLIVGSKTASNAKVTISFNDPVTNASLIKINGRWSTTKEPVDYKGGVNVGDALIASRETLPPNEDSSISIAIKKSGNIEAFAFNNESYLYAWYKPDFELTEKRYIVDVQITADGHEWNKKFILLNLGNTTRNFKLLTT